MKFLFDDASFSFETLRTIGYAPYGGADIGEVVSTAGRIPEGDEAAWYEQWNVLADRVRTAAETSLAAGRTVSAREGYLRASNYHRVSEFYLRTDPRTDPRILAASRAGADAFAHAAGLLDRPLIRVEIPFEGTTLPGWWVPADDVPDPRGPRPAQTSDGQSPGEEPASGGRPVLLFHGGFDSAVDELYFAAGAAAARRGYHALLFDGPGQGSVLREQHLPFRPDWEVVVTAALDWLLDPANPVTATDTIDPAAVALMGMSMGGLLASRAAAFEHRLAALIAYDGVHSMPDTVNRPLPQSLRELIEQDTAETDARANAVLADVMAASTQQRWTFLNGMWTFDVATPVDVVRVMTPYDLRGVAGKITCPTLVLDAENDLFFAGQAETLRDAITAPVAHHLFREADGSGEHCQDGAMSTLHQVVFDWLDTTLATTTDVTSAS